MFTLWTIILKKLYILSMLTFQFWKLYCGYGLLWTEQYPSAKFICWNPNPGTSAYEYVLIRRIWTYKRAQGTCTHKGQTMWGDKEKGAVCKPTREASGETKPASTLILNVQVPELQEHIFLPFKSPNLWYFMSFLANGYSTYILE